MTTLDLPTRASDRLAVTAVDVWRTYRSGSRQEVQALRGVDFQARAGSFVALKGRSGSGKTTLLNCIGGLDRPTSGQVYVFGKDITALSGHDLLKFRRSKIGFVFQSFGLSPLYSAYENVELVLRFAGADRTERRERALHCLDLVGLSRWIDHRPDELSGGQQQRVAIARALANTPQLILADEPTGELDSQTAREILSLFQWIVREEGTTVLMSSHDALVAEYVDRVFEIQDGEITSETGP